MSQITLEEIKAHCQADDFTDDDDLLADLQGVAEEYVQKHVRRDLEAELPGAWPPGCVHAVKLLVAYWYGNRAAVGDGSDSEVPMGVRDLLAPHRDLSA